MKNTKRFMMGILTGVLLSILVITFTNLIYEINGGNTLCKDMNACVQKSQCATIDEEIGAEQVRELGSKYKDYATCSACIDNLNSGGEAYSYFDSNGKVAPNRSKPQNKKELIACGFTDAVLQQEKK